ncbi:Serpentine Receptor, class H [Caenorhabditis elegans]|uniref:Serpentine Receptor, class H n=1 Tax=Caenorhabditis elegans TaxID=6239 RepID=Q9GUB7_CAEEL|nr:Serpentine Receptor, class H [Caenorhabditis elegans]CCD65098.1 Serpentine Receptor, class H [Caenorhabditis elegans]|eukprot:NP_504918.1 Serpentine Receptor, class H [Caenorhabditis elegans]
MAHSVSEYYSTNYSQCVSDDSFLSSWKGLVVVCFSIQLVSIPCHFLTFYLIFTKTPSSMKFIKFPLLLSHFWSMMLDFWFGILSTPYIFFPNLVLFGCGVLNFFRFPILISFILGINTLIFMNLSLIYLYESRSSLIVKNKFKITSSMTRALYYSLNYMSYFPTLYFISKIPMDQESAKLDVLKSMPCPTQEFFTQEVYVLISDPFLAMLIDIAVNSTYMIITSFQIVFHGCCSLYYLYIEPSYAASTRTRSLQRSFFIGITAQTCVPFIVIVTTYIIIILTFLFGNLSQGLFNVCISIIGSHGFVGSIVIILIHGNYRKAVWQSLTKQEVRSDIANCKVPNTVNRVL